VPSQMVYDAYAICRNRRKACSTTCTRGGFLEAKSENGLVEGRDMNTKFFHTSAIAHIKWKKVSKLRTDDGRTATSQEDVCNVAQGYFEQLFSVNAGVHEPVLDLVSQCVAMDDNILLTTPIIKEKLRKALFADAPEQVPRSKWF